MLGDGATPTLDRNVDKRARYKRGRVTLQGVYSESKSQVECFFEELSSGIESPSWPAGRPRTFSELWSSSRYTTLNSYRKTSS